MDLFQVLAEMKSPQCQVGWRFHVGLVGDGRNLAVQPAHQHRAPPPGPAVRSFSCYFPLLLAPETRQFMFGVFLFFGLVAASRFGVRVGFLVFLGCFGGFSGGGFSLFLPAALSCILASPLFRKRAFAGKPAAMAPDPPLVVN